MSASPAPTRSPIPTVSYSHAAAPSIPGSLASSAPAQVFRPQASRTDIASLRSAALYSAKRQKVTMTADDSPSEPTYASSDNRSMSNLIAPLANVDISKVDKSQEEEKEEGEISEDEEMPFEMQMEDRSRQRRYSPPRHHSSSSGPSFSAEYRPRRSSVQSSGSTSTLAIPQPRPDRKGKGKEVSPGPVASAPTDISPSEARQYMDVIRKLLQEGFSPDDLIRRGATAKYVKAVCEEIVKGTSKHKSVWMISRDSAQATSLDSAMSPPAKTERSPSPEIDMTVSMRRSNSISSEGSAENVLLESISPPRRTTFRLLPSSSWTPTSRASTPKQATEHPLKLESLSTPPNPQTIPLRLTATPVQDVRLSRDWPKSVPQSALRPGQNGSPAHAIPRPILPGHPVAFANRSNGPAPFVPVNHDTPISHNPSADSEIATKNALLETRRKVLESMRARRAALDTKTIHDSSAVQVTVIAPTPTAEKSIEDEVADLEQEVLSLQAASTSQSAPKPIDADEDSEEGEISSSTPSPPIIPPTGPRITAAVAALPDRPPRGLKRPVAEELDGRPISAPSRALAPKRRLFGALQRPHRLLLPLDDSDSDSGDEDGVSTSDSERQRLMEEKEREIRRLKDLIAAKMKAKQRGATATPTSLPMIPTLSDSYKLDVVRDEIGRVQPANEGAVAITEEATTEPGSATGVTTARLAEPDDTVSPVPVGTPDLSTSAQANFQAYQPMLPRYPQLVNSSAMMSALPMVPLPPMPAQDHLVATLQTINNSLLSTISLTNRLRRDPSAVMCRSEASGGQCADPTCGDVHLDKGLQPTFEDVSEYIAQVLAPPGPSKSTINAAVVAAKLHLTQGQRGDKVKPNKPKPLPTDVVSASSAELEILIRQVGLLLRR